MTTQTYQFTGRKDGFYLTYSDDPVRIVDGCVELETNRQTHWFAPTVWMSVDRAIAAGYLRLAAKTYEGLTVKQIRERHGGKPAIFGKYRGMGDLGITCGEVFYKADYPCGRERTVLRKLTAAGPKVRGVMVRNVDYSVDVYNYDGGFVANTTEHRFHVWNEDRSIEDEYLTSGRNKHHFGRSATPYDRAVTRAAAMSHLEIETTGKAGHDARVRLRSQLLNQAV